MTRRERLENKIERREDWAASATAKASALSNESHRMMSVIPFGQPILVGHHSEGRDRNYRNRAWNKMGQAVALRDKAEMHESKAANLSAALDRTIFSDDDNSIEALESRIAEREAQRERMKKINAMYRKGDAEGLAAVGLNLENLRAKLKDAYSWCQQPHPSYELSNLGGRITADRKRLEHVKRMKLEQAEAEATENGVKIDRHSNGYATVRFAEKPDYAIIRALKDASFRWGGGSWFGQTADIPECVAHLAEPVAAPVA